MPTRPKEVDQAQLARAFGRALKRAREDRNLKITDLSRASGVSRAYISKIEAGDRLVKIDTLYRLALALKIKPSALLP